ncbi:MAG: helix-turn-helix domain-containing protein [Bacillus sp. (in: Bacteria)]|uniref:Helix-turn-helix domain-containing protein n=2 Tax=Niallia TaxID=2837506 RepID=A0A941GGA5_NIACI|nr:MULTISPECIES: helix-turn-helix domain-containing protein [Niallia]MBQ6447663.1 helix-turn-helix domain-containing protein [Bacillus sp. (in: firmicutes)]MDU1844514.1 helix-turn-helix domain-containing protein [Niallia nealsonii]MCB5236822.1 helix-turn-helix domain-containing protein [Niallia circulans]MED3793162.1 helix-turn-helix domain-containing protein [Niallia alba]NMO76207.1 helix-turn-helix domain-containing protein [Niallia alba]
MLVGAKIKKLRLKRGFSINELSDKSGVSKSYLSYIERGIQKNPSLQVLTKLAYTLDTNVEELLDNHNSAIDGIDEDWISLVEEAIEDGITKEDFAGILEYVKFKKRQEN